MSHFSVLVIGADPEAQLAPYDENTRVEPYKERLSNEDISSMAKHYGIDPSDRAALVAQMGDWYGDDAGGGEDGDGLFRWSTYNPQSKWDWYSLGGRWTGHLILKPGAVGDTGRTGIFTEPAKPGTADAARKGDIDFEAMKWDKANDAATRYDVFAAIAANLPAAVDFKDIKEESIDRKRSIYWNQPLIVALRDANVLGFDVGPNAEFGMGRDDYISNAARKAPATYAMVAEGVWKGRGRMGWFGFSADEIDPEGWVDFWWKMVDGLPDDTLLSVYDCHI